jgi:hypothetical protein
VCADEGEALVNADEDVDMDDTLQDNKMGAKKQRKLEEKEEKRRQREVGEISRNLFGFV